MRECAYVRENKRERESVCVKERDRERERVCEREGERERDVLEARGRLHREAQND